MSSHRTQADRSASTRAALIDAAVLLLIERGWGATTSVSVCEVADVSRGALHHHFEDLGHVLSEALEKLCTDLRMDNSSPSTSVLQVVNRTWSIFSDRRFKAVMEAWWASANDAEISRRVRPVMVKVAAMVAPETATVALFRRSDVKSFIQMSRETMLGMAMGRATNGGVALAHEKSVLSMLRQMARQLDG